jgi:hypothetical protein
MSPEAVRTPFARTSQYDEQFERDLTQAIATTVIHASRITDANCIAVRTGETIAALTNVLATQLALIPGAHQSKSLRDAVEKIAKRLRSSALATARDPETQRFTATAFRNGDVGGRA